MGRRCAYCGDELPANARSTARYCQPAHRWACARLRSQLRIVEQLLAGTPAGGFSTPAAYAASKRSIARAAKIGTGRGGYRPAKRHTHAADARTSSETHIRSNRRGRAA